MTLWIAKTVHRLWQMHKCVLSNGWMILTTVHKSIGRRCFLSATLSTTNPTLKQSPALRGQRPATDRIRHGMESLHTWTRTRRDIVLIRDVTPCDLVGRETTNDTSGYVTLGDGNFLTKWATDSFLRRVPHLWYHCLVHHYYATDQNINDLDSVGTYPKLRAKLAHMFRRKPKSVSLSSGRGVQSIKSQKPNLCTSLTRHNRKQHNLHTQTTTTIYPDVFLTEIHRLLVKNI